MGLGDKTSLGATVAVGVGVIGTSDNTSEAGDCSALSDKNGAISLSNDWVTGVVFTPST